MTTIEFCEKSMKRTGYDTSVYDRGVLGNVRAVLGDNPLLWLLPCAPPSGDGLYFIGEETPLVPQREMEAGRGIRRKAHQAAPSEKRTETAGTGECASDDEALETGNA